MAFSDSIEASFLTTVYVTRASEEQDGSGNFTTSPTTITYGLRGDLQPASRSVFHSTGQGADYRISHTGFFDVPVTLPVEGDTLVDDSAEYAVRSVRNFVDHLELDLERLHV